jgi:hypothetical protein
MLHNPITHQPAAVEAPAVMTGGLNRSLLRLEGLAALLAAIAAYWYLGGSGWLFVALLLAPDVSMLGYLRGPKTGALLYNAVHNYALALALTGAALAAGWSLGVLLGLILLAHIGMDRLLGYGLKYPTGFKDTHLQRV